MALVYFIKNNIINKVETHPTWEDAYIAVTSFAESNNLELCEDGAQDKESNHYVKILKTQ
jgi:hypothetical protein